MKSRHFAWAVGLAVLVAYVRVGKSTTAGEWVASIHHVAIDLTGAFSP